MGSGWGGGELRNLRQKVGKREKNRTPHTIWLKRHAKEKGGVTLRVTARSIAVRAEIEGEDPARKGILSGASGMTR